MAQLSSCPHIFAPKTVNNHDAGIPCIHRFLEAPVKAAEEYHAEVFDFLFKWIAEAPWLDHTIDSKVAVPVVRTRNEKKCQYLPCLPRRNGPVQIALPGRSAIPLEEIRAVLKICQTNPEYLCSSKAATRYRELEHSKKIDSWVKKNLSR